MTRRERTGTVAMEPVLVNKAEACEALGGISISTLDQEMRAGHINSKVMAGRPMFTPEELRRYVNDLKDWTPAR